MGTSKREFIVPLVIYSVNQKWTFAVASLFLGTPERGSNKDVSSPLG